MTAHPGHVQRDPGRGFADPVFDGQAVYRAVLDALSRPGTIHSVARPGLMPPPELSPAAAALLLTLADHDTPVWLAGGARHPAAHWLAFHAGAPSTDDPAAAAFAVTDGATGDPLLAAFPAGEDRYPDQSATVIVAVDDLENGQPVTLAGPGIRDRLTIAPGGLRPGFWDEVGANHGRFPRGVDLILASGDRIVGLPRSTRVEVR